MRLRKRGVLRQHKHMMSKTHGTGPKGSATREFFDG